VIIAWLAWRLRVQFVRIGREADGRGAGRHRVLLGVGVGPSGVSSCVLVTVGGQRFRCPAYNRERQPRTQTPANISSLA
jgi:hypothetical protein